MQKPIRIHLIRVSQCKRQHFTDGPFPLNVEAYTLLGNTEPIRKLLLTIAELFGDSLEARIGLIHTATT